MSNYCACSGGDEEYSIELNQQGPEGPQGEVGPEGFSPSISVKTNTDKAYILTITNKEGSFNTPNLYGELEKLNADLTNLPNPAYLNGVILSQNEEGIPSIQLDTSKATVDTDGNLVFSASSTDEEVTETFNYELVINPSEQRLELHDNEGNVKIVATTDYIPTIDVATTEVAGVVKPDGSTITVTPDGTISANLSNYVTSDELAVDLQDINSKIASKLDTATYEADKATYATKEELASTDATVASIQTSLNNKLEESNIIAGANIAIDRSGNNLTISSTGGGGGTGGVAIDDGSTSSVTTWSSSKINSEITTVIETKNDNIFDIGKFTIVGSPTITDDGVASGTKSNSILSSITLQQFLNKSWSVKGRYFIDLTKPTPILRFSNSWMVQGAIQIEDNQLKLKIKTGDTTESSSEGRKIFLNIASGSWYDITVSFNLSTGIYSLLAKNIDTGTLYSGTWVATTTNKQLYLINKGNNGAIECTYESATNAIQTDLKHFSITVDGVNVFNGLMESTKPIYDKLSTTTTELSSFKLDTDNNFSAVESALNEKANLSDLAGKQNTLTAGTNITIEGNVISATGGDSTAIDDNAPSTTTVYSSTKVEALIQALTDRISALETEINGGNA